MSYFLLSYDQLRDALLIGQNAIHDVHCSRMHNVLPNIGQFNHCSAEWLSCSIFQVPKVQ